MKISRVKISFILICIFVLFFGNSMVDAVVKNSNHYGAKFNSERKKNNLSLINENWIINSDRDVNFKISWSNILRNKKHYSKTLEYGYFGPKKEIDEYISNPESFNYYYSVYDFNTKKFEYYLSMCSGSVEVNRIITEKEFISKTKE